MHPMPSYWQKEIKFQKQMEKRMKTKLLIEIFNKFEISELFK